MPENVGDVDDKCELMAKNAEEGELMKNVKAYWWNVWTSQYEVHIVDKRCNLLDSVQWTVSNE